MPDLPANPLIVIVDDNPAQRYATRRMLESAGFVTKECATGQEALTAAQNNPDLIILDVKLPDINGFEVCRRLKADVATASVPVLHLSAMVVSTSGRVTGLESGADAYLTQPVEPDELVATIRTLLRARSAEKDLRASEQRYRSMFEYLPLPCWLIHRATSEVLAMNRMALRRYGFSADEKAALSIAQIVPECGLHAIASLAEKNGGTYTQHARHQHKDGAAFDVEVTWVPVEVAGAQALLGIVYDLTERRAALEARQKAHQRQAILQRVLAAQEQERRRVARELHDEAGQLLTSLLVGLRTLESAKSLTEAKASARQLRKITSSSLDAVGRLARGLHPVALEDLGLGAALERLAGEFSESHKIQVDIGDSLGKLNFLDRDTSLALYRIAQEALTNVGKHAKASRVSIAFAISGKVLQFSIKDNGAGYDGGQMNGNHLGIQGMRERAAMLGGKVMITCGRQRSGTTVTLILPISSQTPAHSS
jgi:PAS domain S-box-containing protein